MRITTVKDLGLMVRARRRALQWSQQDLAREAGVSRSWIIEFESGKTRAEADLVLRAVDALGLVLDVSDPRSDRSAADAHPTDLVDLDEVVAQHTDSGSDA